MLGTKKTEGKPLFIGIRWRLVSYYLAVLAVVVMVMGAFFTWFLDYFNRENLRGHLFNQARLVAALVEEAAAEPDPGDLDALCKKLGAELGLRLTIVAADGTVLGDSDEEPARMENHLDRPEIRRALEEGEGSSVRYSSTIRQEMLYVAVTAAPGDGFGPSAAIVRVALSLAQVNAAVHNLRLFTFGALFFSALAALALGLGLSSRITGPLKEISRAARAIAGGDFEPPLAVKGRDELADLAHTVREMGRALRKQVQQLTLEKNKLEAVISSMNSGVILVDRDLRLELLNPAAEKLFDLSRQEVVGQPVRAALRHHSLYENLAKVLTGGNPRQFELSLYYPRKAVLQVSLLPVTGARGDVMRVLGIFHDITALRTIEQMRSGFVANVSHELRTPLASIKGYAETVLNRDLEEAERREFLQVIDREAARLSRLVDSLLELSRIEGEKETVKKEAVDLVALLQAALSDLEEQRRQKRVILQTDLPAAPVYVSGNPDWLRQALVNILDNGIKYGRPGGHLTVRLSKRAGRAVVEIADDGPGIPAADLPYVFERFYRVDKARSRKTGGTGLGLAIVKHILEAHGAAYTIESEEGRGTLFRFSLPLY